MQKEQLSAMMDGETVDSALLSELYADRELQQSWRDYHLIRDTLRGDVPEVLHFDITARVA
ncbi:MAG: RseA family anti-sigma factor, partial [Plesiomonas shigelloides]